jgi:hypothetical protein
MAARLRERIAEAEQELARLKGTPLHILMDQVRDAGSSGRDLLGELAERLRERIGRLREELAGLGEGGAHG